MNVRPLIATLLLAAAFTSAAAEERGVQTITHRVTGLSCPEREADLREAVAENPEVKLLGIDFARAEASFAYDPKIITTEQVRQLLGARGFGFKTTPPIPADQLTRLEIGILGLDCKGCSLGAYNVVMKIDGVEQATASFKEGRIVAQIDANKTNRAAVEDALKKARVELTAP